MAETMRRSGAISPTTFDDATMTVDAVLSSFADVRRNGFVERLDPVGLDSSRLVGAPLLDSHRSGSARDVIGVVTAVRIEDGKLVGTIRLSQADDVAATVQKIREGALRGVSLGYRVSRWVETNENGTRVRTAAAWTPIEVSAVAVPADPASLFRSQNMTTENEQQTGIETPMPPVSTDAPRIHALAEVAGLTPEWADNIVRSGLGLEDARLSAQAELMRRSQAAPSIRTQVGASNDDPAVIVRRQTDALVYRAVGGKLPDDARQYVGSSFKDIATSALKRAGISTRGLGTDETFQRAAMGTSDFPLVVSNTAGKIALDRYRAAASELMPLVRQRTLPDFKTATAIRMGEIGEMPPLTEHGEFRAKSFAENGEKMSVSTYGGTLDVSRVLMTNDDANLLGDLASALADGAAATVSGKLAAQLTAPGKMSDGKVPFHADRGNLAATGSDIGVDGLDAARKAMRVVKGIDGKTIVGAAPKYIVCGPDAETDAEKVLAAIYAATPADANVFSGRLQLLVEPRLAGTGWFTFADPARLPCLWLAYLAGAQGPQIQRTEAWDTLGMRFRVFLDFGVGWSDWRGAYKNPGA